MKMHKKVPHNDAYFVILLGLMLATLVIWATSLEMPEFTPIQPVKAKEAASVQIPVKTGKFTVPMEIQQAVREVCSTYGEPCERDLIALCLKESGCRLGKTVTNKNSNGTVDEGPFQINTIHSVKDPFDPTVSAKWALDHLLANGWPTYRTFALGAHHSRTPSLNKPYGESVKRIADSL